MPETKEYFSYNSKKDSFYCYCLSCKRAKYKERMQKLKEDGKYEEYRTKERQRSCRWNENNKEYLKEYFRVYHLENKERRNKSCRDNYYKNHEERLKKAKQYYKDHYQDIQIYYKNKWENDYLYRLKLNYRCVIKDSFRRRSVKKRKKAEDITGLSTDELIEHLLNTFEKNYGYKWDGNESVDIDHIIPLSKASTEEEVIALCHYSNLQLLKSSDNRSKQDKFDYKIKE